MTAKLTDHEKWRREIDRWVAKSGVSEAEYLPRILAVTEDLIRLHHEHSLDWPGLPRTFEHLYFQRWEMMTRIARLQERPPTT